MIIILGMDNTGKSTLTQQLSYSTGLVVRNSLGPDAMKDEQETFIEEGMHLNREMIFERFPLFEEIVYGNVLRGESNFSLDDRIAKRLQSKQPIIIYCRPPKSTIREWNDREQMYGVIERSSKLINAWDELIFTLIAREWKVFPYDWTDSLGYSQLVELVDSELTYKQIFKPNGGTL